MIRYKITRSKISYFAICVCFVRLLRCCTVLQHRTCLSNMRLQLFQRDCATSYTLCRDIHFYDKRPGKKSVKPSPLMVDPQPDNANNDVLSPDGQPISHLTVLQALEAIQQEHQEQQQHLLQADTNNVQQQQQAMAMHQQPAQVVPQSPHVLQDNLAHPPPTPQRTRWCGTFFSFCKKCESCFCQ